MPRPLDLATTRMLALCCLVAAGCGDNHRIDDGADAMPDDQTLIQIEPGAIQGSIIGTSRQFLGIPYAAPPVGALRWKPPHKPDPWPGVRAATAFGKRCAQLASATLQTAASTDEDCLYLNVWSPAPAPASALPVMVWIHGGANTTGSASDAVPFLHTGVFYSGESLAEDHGVIVVSLNYRLGLFGFFEHPALSAEGSAGNQGLLDQQLALQWVHDNIAKFGGDPGNVTLFGESAGAFDVCMHVAAPSSAGLFQRAISESGGCTTRQRTKPEAVAQGTAYATAVGCTGATALDCLRGKPAADLLAAPAAATTDFALDVDGAFMPDQPRALYDAGHVAHVPYLLGSNTDEGTLFVGGLHLTEDHDYKDTLEQLYGSDPAQAILAHYPLTDFAGGMPNPATAAIARVIGDANLVCPTFDTAARMAQLGGPVFMYNFDIPLDLPGLYLGASHGSEIASVFGTSPVFTNDTKAASELMQRYWAGFARTGDPNEGVDPTWPAFTAAANLRMNFALAPTVVTDFRAAQCAFWRTTYGQQL